ncbi:MAG TPA: nicotinamide riboside transporter PnuC [Bacteroidales bacterium]|jgi:nicotinamide mononucleotide transporter|nr:nicotinamide riboside transporter PnuC [Bacteroidales bacterium]HOG56789.1 nicotinamide riboside transporter PnuC [Bacteroidales bacterium]HPX44397.1 nicotinamide riboside transporter PnuC [Bacteroidales bacterium]
MNVSDWIATNWIEIFGALSGIIYVFLEIRQNIWLWPVGIVTSAVYIVVFFASKFYADMSLQGYYLVMSCIGWYWWVKGTGHGAQGTGHRAQGEGHGAQGAGSGGLQVTRLRPLTGLVLAAVFILSYTGIWFILSRFTDSPVPGWDSFITSLSAIATWMLARKIYEHWYLWIAVNAASVMIFVARGLYPTVILYAVYLVMSFAGLKVWKRSISA